MAERLKLVFSVEKCRSNAHSPRVEIVGKSQVMFELPDDVLSLVRELPERQRQFDKVRAEMCGPNSGPSGELKPADRDLYLATFAALESARKPLQEFCRAAASNVGRFIPGPIIEYLTQGIVAVPDDEGSSGFSQTLTTGDASITFRAPTAEALAELIAAHERKRML